MSDKTPKRPVPTASGYSPINLHESPASASPQKNLTGLPRVTRDLIADLYNHIQRWNDHHIQGVNIIQQIMTEKAANPKTYSTGLEELINALFNIVQNLRSVKVKLISFSTQMEALVKLHKQSTPLFISYSTKSLLELIEEIVEAYTEEFQVKEFILENLAHCKNKMEAMVYGTLWTYQYRLGDTTTLKLEILLMESGHRKCN